MLVSEELEKGGRRLDLGGINESFKKKENQRPILLGR